MVKTLWSDTLFARLFVLLWATLLVSHAAAFLVVTQVVMPLTKPHDAVHGAHPPRPPVVFPSLPPAGGETPGLPVPLLVLDYTIRLLFMGLGAWWGARWLTQPVSQLVQAANAMSTALAQGQPPNAIDEKRGPVEAQQAARVFNQLSTDLYKAFRSRELLSATVSHDLRTPLTRMRLRLESQPGPEAVAQCIQDIAQMDEMVRSALAMVRLRAGAQAVSPTRIDVLVQALVDDYAEMGAQLVWPESAAAPPITALADPLALRRVLDNVVQNALRHGACQHLAVRIEAAHTTVAILLEDDGPGIEQAKLAGIFEPCLRTTTAQDSEPGNGLGLYIAQDLMRLQGGSIALSNRPEGGLRVRLELARKTT